jgi:hypothetical protein
MRSVLALAAGVCLYAFSAPMALAAQVPKLDVAPLCHGIADQGADPLEAGDPAVSFKQCIESEQQDRASVVKEWPQFSAESKQMCTDEATAGGESSYTDLLTCLEMARDVHDYESSRASD